MKPLTGNVELDLYGLEQYRQIENAIQWWWHILLGQWNSLTMKVDHTTTTDTLNQNIY